MSTSLAPKILLLFGNTWPPAGVDDVLWYMGFSKNYSAPLTSPHTAALDGDSRSGGRAVLTQTDGQYSTSGGNLAIPAQSTPTWGDQGFIGQAANGDGFARAAGLAYVSKVNVSSGVTAWTGFGDASGLSYTDVADDYSLFYLAFGELDTFDSGGTALKIGSWSTATDYTFIVIARLNGGYFLLQNDRLVYVVAAGTAGTLYPVLSNQQIVATMPTAVLVKLSDSTQFATDYGSVTQRLAGARSAGDTYSHTADCLIETTITTLPSAGQIELEFRQDTANTDCWRVTVDSAGNLDLDELVSGTPTQRGTSAAAVANGNRLVIVADDDDINVYCDDVLEITYTSAANFKTAIAGELESEGTGGAVSDIVTWPFHVDAAFSQMITELAGA